MPLPPLSAVLLSLQLVAPVLPPLASAALARQRQHGQQREFTFEPGHSGWVPASPMASAAMPDGPDVMGGARPPGAVRPMEGPQPFTNEATFPLEWPEEGSVTPLPEVYRPWSLRYMLSPAHAPASLEKGKREFREGFRSFTRNNPNHPVAPNSEDRQAQSLVILVFVLAVLGMVAGAGFGMEKLQEAAHPEKHLLTLAASLSLPWVLAMGWLVHVALRYFGHAAREPGHSNRQSWRCSAAVWYLLIVPPLTTLNILVQALWLSSLHSRVGFQASMGRMLPTPGASPWASRSVEDPGEKSSKLATVLVAPCVRYSLIGLEAISVLAGLLLLTLCGQHLCAPEVWWATLGLTATTAAVLAAGPAVLMCGYVVSTLGGFKQGPHAQGQRDYYVERRALVSDDETVLREQQEEEQQEQDQHH